MIKYINTLSTGLPDQRLLRWTLETSEGKVRLCASAIDMRYPHTSIVLTINDEGRILFRQPGPSDEYQLYVDGNGDVRVMDDPQ